MSDSTYSRIKGKVFAPDGEVKDIKQTIVADDATRIRVWNTICSVLGKSTATSPREHEIELAIMYAIKGDKYYFEYYYEYKQQAKRVYEALSKEYAKDHKFATDNGYKLELVEDNGVGTILIGIIA
jgi:hypothetical protein